MSLGVGVGDVVLVSGLAWRLYKACKESSEDFRRMSTELMSLDAVLRETVDYMQEHEDLDISRRNRLVILCDGCRSTLRDLEDLVNRYESLGTQAQRTWDRMRFGLKDLSDVRSRLVSTTTLLNAFNTTLINSSTTRIEKRLNKFLTEVQAGLREGSVVTTTDAVETIESPDVWAELRRELEDIGIGATVVEENRKYITSWMKTALAEGCMDERPPAPMVEPSDSGYGSGEGSIRRPSVISLNAANEEFEEEVYKQRCERPLDDIFEYMAVKAQPPPTIKKRKGADPGRMLKKLFQKDTAIIQAASDGDINKVAKLISLGMDVNARDRWGWSALSMCGYGGYKAIARLLLDHGANLDNIDVDGDTPSSLAAQRGHTEVVILFDEERAARDLRLREMDEEIPRPVQI